MPSFEFKNGCVIVYDQGSGGGGSSLISVSPEISSSNESPVLITGVQTNDRDLVLPIVTLDNFRILYTFGQDFGDFNIVGIALLGAAGTGGDALKSVVSWFKANRVTNKQSPVTVSLGGGGSYEVFITGLNIAEADTAFHLQPFIIAGRIAKVP